MEEPEPDFVAAHVAKIRASRFLDEWLTEQRAAHVSDDAPLNANLTEARTELRTRPGLAFSRLAIAWRRWVSLS